MAVKVAQDRHSPDIDGDGPTSFCGYALHEVLGRGGMGVVYRATDPAGQPVALKILRHDVIPGEHQAHDRLLREATIRLDHPNVVRILDAGSDEAGRPFIALELLEGESLEDRLIRRDLNIGDAVDIARQLARGLAHAHDHGVIHRDLKPSNVHLCVTGDIKLLDFGIARMLGRETRLTAQGSVVGTPAYLAPEQARGDRPVDARTDIWALGVLLFEMLTGRSPFERDTPLATMLAVLMEEAPPVVSLAPNVPAALADVVARCLKKEATARWPSGHALHDALAAVSVRPEVLARLGEGAAPSPSATDVSLPPVHPTIAPGEQRVVAVLLASGITDLQELSEAIRQHRGILLPLAGDRGLGLFGAERWEGDEAIRAATVALRARSSAADMAVASGRASYSQHTGIAGAVLASAEAGCAAKLRGIAIDANTAKTLEGRFRLQLVAEDLYELLDAASPTGVQRTTATNQPIFGREAEIAQLQAACRTVLDGRQSTVVLVSGPPGIGKSRLRLELERLLEYHNSELHILSAQAEPIHQEVSFSLVAGLLSDRMRRDQALARTDPAARIDDGRPDVTIGSGGGDPDAAPRADGRVGTMDGMSADEASGDRRDRIRALVHEAMGDDENAEECAAFFGEMLGVSIGDSVALRAARGDPQLMSDRLRFAVEDYFAAFVERAPLAIVVEDLQWADPTSLDILEELATQLRDRPLLLFATGRPELGDRRPDLFDGLPVVRIEPHGLLPKDVTAMAATILGHSLPTQTIRTLSERTAGNPLFVEQLLFAMRDEGLERAPESLPLPLTVEAALQSRLDHLPPQEKDLCKRASVFGHAFTATQMQTLGVGDSVAALSSLARRNILTVQPRSRTIGERAYEFRHRLLREVAYRLIAEGLRQDLHRQVAVMLSGDQDGDAEEAAGHFEQAHLPEEAAQYYARASAAATRRGDIPTTLRCSAQALALGAPRALRHELHMSRSDALQTEGKLDAQIAELDQALVAAATDAERARTLTDRAVWLLRAGRSEEACAAATDAECAAMRSTDPQIKALTVGRHAAIELYTGKLDAAAERLARAESLARDGAPTLLPLVAIWRAQLAGVLGDLGGRRDAYREAVERYASTGDIRRAAGAAVNLADVHNRVGAYAQAEKELTSALDQCRRVGLRLDEGYGLINLGYSLSRQGRILEALSAIEQAAEIARSTGDVRLGLVVTIYRARALAGDAPQKAAEAAEDAAQRAEAHGLEALAALALTVAAAALLAADRPKDAVIRSQRALEIREKLGGIEEDEAEVFLTHARALSALGRERDAASVRIEGRQRLEEIAGRIGDPALRQSFLQDIESHRELLAG